jgi:hypothetical protein
MGSGAFEMREKGVHNHATELGRGEAHRRK